MSQTVVDDRDISKTDRGYEVLRRRIRELALAPGAPLRKEEIAVELGVSRAPVRDAISRLAEEGLIDVFPQHGSFVALIRAADVRESLFVRTALEVEAMRRLAALANASVLNVLDANIASQVQALSSGNLEQFYDLDEALHAAMFGALKTLARFVCSKPHALRLTGCVDWRFPIRADPNRPWRSIAHSSKPFAPAMANIPRPPCVRISPWSAEPSN